MAWHVISWIGSFPRSTRARYFGRAAFPGQASTTSPYHENTHFCAQRGHAPPCSFSSIDFSLHVYKHTNFATSASLEPKSWSKSYRATLQKVKMVIGFAAFEILSLLCLFQYKQTFESRARRHMNVRLYELSRHFYVHKDTLEGVN